MLIMLRQAHQWTVAHYFWNMHSVSNRTFFEYTILHCMFSLRCTKWFPLFEVHLCFITGTPKDCELSTIWCRISNVWCFPLLDSISRSNLSNRLYQLDTQHHIVLCGTPISKHWVDRLCTQKYFSVQKLRFSFKTRIYSCLNVEVSMDHVQLQPSLIVLPT